MTTDCQTQLIEMPTGTLTVSVEASELPLDTLCTYAARINPKRGFLFASRYLAREMPATPSSIADLHSRLAGKLADDLPGPILFVGMAEYAISLGQGVYEAYHARTGREDILYIHSTRYRLSRESFIDFQEEHSHAPAHILYVPDSEEDKQLLARVKTLVLIDDEASTGKTFRNLALAFQKMNPHLQQVVTMVITDWRGEEQRKLIQNSMPAPCTDISLLNGSFQFSGKQNLQVEMPNVTGCCAPKDHLLAANHGRFGVRGKLEIEEALIESLNISEGERLLVVGSGEFVHLPYLLAHTLEARCGAKTWIQSTTRNPLMTWGPIECTFTFTNKVHNIPSFLYNCRPEEYDRVILCLETPANLVDPALLNFLNCQVLSF
ncbi:MAG: phosphoribosyltransferase domain-containing protein [Candidatus Melainabacteria bacterium]|nr:phosphoribosyltransferase domain-containing protein [Candidatus Melainabacteria bacterium]